MADYIEILDTQVDPDAPITSSLGYQFKNNVLAIAEGSVGAPRIQLNGAIERLNVGSDIRYSNNNVFTTQSQSEVDVASITIMQAGTARFTLAHKGNGATSTARIKKTRDSTETIEATFSTASGSYVTETVDIDLLAGDVITYAHRRSGGSAVDIDMTALTLRTGGADLIVGDGMGGFIRNNRAVT
jgi:hypothetical protein